MAASLVATSLSQGEAQHKVTRERANLEDVRQHLRNNLACAVTLELQRTVCSASASREITAYNGEKKPLFGPAGRRVGDHYELRALCGSRHGTDSLHIDYRSVGSADGREWRDLFDGFDLVCPSVAGAACTTKTVKFAPQEIENCPSNYAALAADDSDEPRLGCCPLPFSDILDGAAPRLGGKACGPGEIATGVLGKNLVCTKINTALYTLLPPQATCYVGSGASGSSGSSGCTAPSATYEALTAKFGSDACLGYPFGSLIVSRTGDDCGDVAASVLVSKRTGRPVQMVP